MLQARTEAAAPWSTRGQRLVAIARESIARALGADGIDGGHASEVGRTDGAGTEAWLREPAATFVTIFRGNELQGCIGSVEPRRSLEDDVRANAVGAALEDPRFPALRPDQLADLRVEVSVLSPLERLAFRSEAEALAAVRPRVDGLVLRCGRRRSVLLPQVWDRRTTPAEFVAALKMKAGLPPDFWGEDVELYRFTLRKFS